MLGNSIRGGQIFWHQLTMLKQVILGSLSVSFATAILVTGLMALPKLPEHDLLAAYSYPKAQMAEWWNRNKLALGTNSHDKEAYPTIDAYNSSGLYAKNIRAKTILAHGKFRLAYIANAL